MSCPGRHVIAALTLLPLAPALPASSAGGEWDVFAYSHMRLTAPEGRADQLALRRCKIIARGPLGPDVTARVQLIYKAGNRSKTDDRIYLLQDACAWKQFGATRVTVGLFKPPMGFERFTPDWRFRIINRSKAINHLIPNGKLGESFTRDIGAQVEQRADRGRLWWAAGLFFGNGAHNDFRGNGPLLAGRVTRTLADNKQKGMARHWCQAGLALSYRKDNDQDFSSTLPGSAAIGYRHFEGADLRWGAELVADWERFQWRSEYLHAGFVAEGATAESRSADGFYLQASYQPSDRWTAALKYEEFDPDKSVADRYDYSALTVGFSHLFDGHDSKLQVDYVMPGPHGGVAPPDTLLVQYQQFLR